MSASVAPTKVITVVGSVNADVIVEITRFPKPGETMAARKNDTGYVLPGGKGANQAVAAKRLGQDAVKVNFIGVFGNDANAGMLRKVMERENIDISQSLEADVPNGQALIFLQADGENSIIIIGGSNQAWPEDGVGEAIAATVRNSDVLLLQREVPDRINEEVSCGLVSLTLVVVLEVGVCHSAGTRVRPVMCDALILFGASHLNYAFFVFLCLIDYCLCARVSWVCLLYTSPSPRDRG